MRHVSHIFLLSQLLILYFLQINILYINISSTSSYPYDIAKLRYCTSLVGKFLIIGIKRNEKINDKSQGSGLLLQNHVSISHERFNFSMGFNSYSPYDRVSFSKWIETELYRLLNIPIKKRKGK